MFQFKGWIPTITGHLSFSTIGLGRNPRKLYKRFRAVNGVRLIVVCQRRRTTDALFGYIGDLVNWLRGREGYSVFVIFGKSFKSDEYDEIYGPCVEFSVSEYKKICGKLSMLKGDLSDKDFSATFDEVFKEFVEASGERPGTVSEFSIRRDGSFTVTLQEEPELDDFDYRNLASQVYFFIRDICHTHQHHAPTSDTILDVTSADDEPDSWQRETAYSLYRWVIQQKRAKSLQAYLGARGVLAYARAFETRFSNPSTGNVPIYLNEPSVASIDAAIEQVREREQNARLFWRVFFNRTLPILGFAIALIALVYDLPSRGQLTTSQKAVAGVADFVNQQLLWIVGALVMVSMAFNVGIVFRAFLAQRQISLDFLRFVLRAPRKLVLVSTLLLIVSVAFLLTGALVEIAVALQPFEPGP